MIFLLGKKNYAVTIHTSFNIKCPFLKIISKTSNTYTHTELLYTASFGQFIKFSQQIPPGSGQCCALADLTPLEGLK